MGFGVVRWSQARGHTGLVCDGQVGGGLEDGLSITGELWPLGWPCTVIDGCQTDKHELRKTQLGRG